MRPRGHQRHKAVSIAGICDGKDSSPPGVAVDVDESKQLPLPSFGLECVLEPLRLRGAVVMVMPVEVHRVQIRPRAPRHNPIRVQHWHKEPCKLIEAALCLRVAHQEFHHTPHHPGGVCLTRVGSGHDAGPVLGRLVAQAQGQDLLAGRSERQRLCLDRPARKICKQVGVGVGNGVGQETLVLLEGEDHVEGNTIVLPSSSAKTTGVVGHVGSFPGPTDATVFHPPAREENRLAAIVKETSGLYQIREVEGIRHANAHISYPEAEPLYVAAPSIRE
mmetsp:Transcript_47729/g.111739  ORF Transcript_47729/g.111739 Transcript_47729/m.111739 type:complete len:276 (-) Transcript_47729:146-973(-)